MAQGIIVVARANIKPGREDEFEALVSDFRRLVLEEGGCLGFELANAPSSPREYTFISYFASAQALQSHRASEPFGQYYPLLAATAENEAASVTELSWL